MGMKKDDKTKTWTVWFSKRNKAAKKVASCMRKNLKTKAEAIKMERKLIMLVERKVNMTIYPTWAKVIDEYTEAQRYSGLSEKSIENCVCCLQAHTVPLWGDKLVNEIIGSEIRYVINEILDGKSEGHKKSVLKFIRGAMTYSLEQGYITCNPTPKMNFRSGDKIKKVLTLDQARTLLTEAKLTENEWYSIWAMAVYTGLRNGELYALTWDKVNLENRQILVDCAWNNKDGFKSTKSGDDRMIEIAPNLLPILNKLKVKRESGNFVLPRIYRWDKGRQAKCLKVFLLNIGLPPVRFHDLRATWATIMLSKGIPAIKVMSMGGWKEMKTMMIYARKAGVEIKGITDCLNIHNPRVEAAKILDLQEKS